MGIFNNLKKNLKVNNLDPSQTDVIDDITKGMSEGKKITINNPMSERFSFHRFREPLNGREIGKDWKPEGDESSPPGFFDSEEINNQPNPNNLPAENTVTVANVPSTCLKQIQYNPKNEALYVKFQNNNKKYWYPGVPEEEVTNLMEATSKGKYFLQNIHNQFTNNPGHSRKANERRSKSLTDNYFVRRSVNNGLNRIKKAEPTEEKDARTEQERQNATKKFKLNKFPWR